MKRRIFPIGLMALLLMACSVNGIDYADPSTDDQAFYASIEASPTRVFVDEKLNVLWNADDRVSIFNKNTYNQQYKFLGKTGDNAGAFNKAEEAEFVTGNPISNVVSVYPYSESTKISNDGVLSVELPSTQKYAEESFGYGSNTMVAVSSDNFLQYKNVGGYLRISLYGEGVLVSSITLKGNNGEKLAGRASVTMPLDGTPSIVLADDAANEITLICDSPIALGASADESKDFWFVVPPVTFEDGFTLTVANSVGESFEKTTTKSFSLSRNSLSRMSALKVDFGNTPDPVESTLAEIAGFADGTTVKTMPVQVMAKTTLGVIIADETQEMFIFSRTPLHVDIGDRIQIIASKTTYRNLPELQNVLSLEILSTGESVTYPTPEDISARTDFDDPFFGDFQYVLLKGTLQSVKTAQYGISYFVERLDDNTLLPFYFFYPSDYQNPEGYTIGDHVWATGYFAGFNPDSMCIIITSMTVESHPVPEAVDLGLPSGIKWASFNLGASKPEEYGDYYAWGEIEPYYSSLDPLRWKEGEESGYSWESYKWCMGSYNKLTKYCSNSSYGYNGFTDTKTILEFEDDAAIVYLGGKWRMPTDDDFSELQNNCTWEWSEMNAIIGRKVTGPNGNSIFFPAAGYCNSTFLNDAGSRGRYWSSSLSSANSDPSFAKTIDFNSINVLRSGSIRYLGLPIRPVCN